MLFPPIGKPDGRNEDFSEELHRIAVRKTRHIIDDDLFPTPLLLMRYETHRQTVGMLDEIAVQLLQNKYRLLPLDG